MPRCIWEPAAGDGAMVRPLKQAGFEVAASDIADYGLLGCETGVDYLVATPPRGVRGVITNPPYRLAMPFARKAIGEVPYVALLLRTNFLESVARLSFFRRHPPARLWLSSRRLPMMHRLGWQGPRAPSNTCFAWFIWDETANEKCKFDWFDWREGGCMRCGEPPFEPSRMVLFPSKMMCDVERDERLKTEGERRTKKEGYDAHGAPVLGQRSSRAARQS
jgi:hypothetical protein